MATNLIAINVYKINQTQVIPVSQAAYNPIYIAPAQIIAVTPVPTGNTNPLPTGVYVYSQIQMSSGVLYYSGITAASVQTLANA